MVPFYSQKWKQYYPEDTKRGIYLHFERNIHPYVRDWLIVYTRWLRKEFEYPVCLNIYCQRGKKIICSDGSPAYGIMIAPENRNRKPRIRLACGELNINCQQSKELFEETDYIMISLTHEIVHYFQYINGFDLDRSRGIEWQATYWSRRIFRYFDSLYDE